MAESRESHSLKYFNYLQQERKSDIRSVEGWFRCAHNQKSRFTEKQFMDQG